MDLKVKVERNFEETSKEISASPKGIEDPSSETKKLAKDINISRVMMTKLIRPSHTDSRGYVYGGQLLSWIDIIASIAARRHTETSCVTRSVDAVHFLKPIKVSEILVLKALVNRSWKTSMEVGVRVETESPLTGERNFCCHAYLTFVALKGGPGLTAPTEVPQIIPSTPSEIRRYEAADIRRKRRLMLAKRPDPVEALREKLQQLKAYDPLSDFPVQLTDGIREMQATYSEFVELVLPQHANTLQITFGGQIIDWMGYCAVFCGVRMSRTSLLIASIDTLQFHHPTYVGNVITVRGIVTETFKTSMEVYVTVSAENLNTGKIEFTNDGFFTLVAVDENNIPFPVPGLKSSNEAEKEAQLGAKSRQEARLRELKCIRALSTNSYSGS